MTNHAPDCNCELCYDDRVNQVFAKINSTIGQGVPFIMSVSASEGTPPFAYTIGFNVLYNLPDVIIFGLSLKYIYGMLMDINEQAKEGLIGNIHNGYEHKSRGTEIKQVLWEVIEREAILEYFGKGADYYIEYHPELISKLRFMQLVWGDDKGVMPYEKGFQEKYKDRQLRIFGPKPKKLELTGEATDVD